MKHLYSFNENKANRRNFFKNILNSIDKIVEGIFRFKILDDPYIHQFVFDSTGVDIDRETKYTKKDDRSNNTPPTISFYRNGTESSGSYKIIYECDRSYNDSIDGICACIDDMGSNNVYDYSVSKYGIRTHVSFSLSVDFNREFCYCRIDGKIFGRYPYNTVIMDAAAYNSNEYRDYRFINSDLLLDLVNNTLSKFINNVYSKKDLHLDRYNSFLNFLYKKLSENIEGSLKDSNEKINKIKDKYPKVYLGLKDRFYKNTEIEDSDRMIDMGFSD